MRPRRVDSQHAAIRDGLRALGLFVADTHTLGFGYPDLTVFAHGRVYLLEVKSPGGQQTPDERRFAADCPAPVHIVYSLDDAVRAIGEGL